MVEDRAGAGLGVVLNVASTRSCGRTRGDAQRLVVVLVIGGLTLGLVLGCLIVPTGGTSWCWFRGKIDILLVASWVVVMVVVLSFPTTTRGDEEEGT